MNTNCLVYQYHLPAEDPTIARFAFGAGRAGRGAHGHIATCVDPATTFLHSYETLIKYICKEMHVSKREKSHVYIWEVKISPKKSRRSESKQVIRESTSLAYANREVVKRKWASGEVLGRNNGAGQNGSKVKVLQKHTTLVRALAEARSSPADGPAETSNS